MVFVLDVPLASVRSVVRYVCVDPGGDLDQLGAGEIRFAVALADLLDQLAGNGSVRHRRNGLDVCAAGVARPEVD